MLHTASTLVCATLLLCLLGYSTFAKECGGAGGIACEEGQFCDIPAGNCAASDMMGVCSESPIWCTADYLPVCGCDGKDYGNDCGRKAAEAQLDHQGHCKKQPEK